MKPSDYHYHQHVFYILLDLLESFVPNNRLHPSVGRGILLFRVCNCDHTQPPTTRWIGNPDSEQQQTTVNWKIDWMGKNMTKHMLHAAGLQQTAASLGPNKDKGSRNNHRPSIPTTTRWKWTVICNNNEDICSMMHVWMAACSSCFRPNTSVHVYTRTVIKSKKESRNYCHHIFYDMMTQ